MKQCTCTISSSLRRTHLFHPKYFFYDLKVLWGPDHFGSPLHTKQIMSRVEAFRDTNLRSLLRELRTDIAMAVNDPFPLIYGLVDKNIITDQLLKVRNKYGNLNLEFIFILIGNVSSFHSFFSILITNICNLCNHQTLKTYWGNIMINSY